MEMDEQRMNFALIDNIPTWFELAGVAGGLVAGTALGILYFDNLRWSISSFVVDGRAARTIVLMVLRFVVLGGLLTLVSLAGPMHLLVVTLGLFVGRSFIIRRTRETA
jgi:F1F0 ATPase subunit 2